MPKNKPPRQRLDDIVALYNQGRMHDVVRKASAAVSEFPNDAFLYNILGAANAALGNLDEAIVSFGKAARIKPDSIEAHNNLGLALGRRGRLEEAIANFETALRLDPDSGDAHNNLGAALKQVGRLEEAMACIGRAVQLVPDHAEAHNNLGLVYQSKGRLDDAIASFSRAVQIKPRFVEAHNNLCGLYERLNRLGDLEKALEEATRSCGEGDSNILFRLAQLASRKNQHEVALGYLHKARIERILPAQKQPFFSLLGKTCDKLGRFDEAFAAFVQHKNLAATSVEAKNLNPRSYFNAILARKAEWASSEQTTWSPPGARAGGRSPIFLVGFPRSGTTLLDTILRSHPRIEVAEEKPMIPALIGVMSKAFGQMPTAANLKSLSEGDVISLQEIYFKEMKTHVSHIDDSQFLVDRSALNILHIDVIHRVFPDAKIVLALRHPCDCVLSCFMQTFKLNDALANFLSLDQSAIFYAAVMDLWLVYQQKLNLNVHVSRYEDLLEDFEGTCKQLLNFLGVEWDNNLRNYQKTALNRGKISTPSYSQVTQPLYKQGKGRWTKYRDQMEPVLPLLRPWIETLGY